MSVPPHQSSIERGAAVLPFAYPLDEFYALAKRELPPIEQIEGEEMPEAYRALLVHQNDMTPTLEAFHEERIYLNVISRQQRDDFYFREVILLTQRTRTPAEFGAIKINLALFPSPARRLILEEQEPLGTILADFKISHASRPKAFLRLQADAFIKGALQLSGDHVLYGRRNTLFDAQQHSLAEIVEILPPLEERS
jgi:chorismate-pyruvate lyase